MKSKRYRNIVLTSMSISADRDKVFSMAKHDKILISKIIHKANEFRKDNIEVFARRFNCIATEKGYFFAMYEDEIEKVDQNEKPYVGSDGRLKVLIPNKEGIDKETDVAWMVAISFVPNPFDFKYVKFKDGNPENCNKKNLYWSQEN